MWATASIGVNPIITNEYTNCGEGMTLNFDNSRTYFDDNCFFYSDDTDIRIIEGSVINQIGSPSGSAKNCFSKSGVKEFVLQNIPLNDPLDFIYYEPPGSIDLNCQRPFYLPEQYRSDDCDPKETKCNGSPAGFTGEDDFCKFDIKTTDMDSLLAAIDEDIKELAADTLHNRENKYLLKQYKGCLFSALNAYADTLLATGNCEKAFALYDKQEDQIIRLQAFSILIDCGSCQKAYSWIYQFQSEDEEIMDYIAVQLINRVRLCDPDRFTPSQQEIDQLYTIGNKKHPHAAYARSLYYVITGNSIRLDLPDIPKETDINPRENTASDKWAVFPNPVIETLTITFDDYIDEAS